MGGFKNIKPLSNHDILNLCQSIPTFKGVFMRDELSNQKQAKNESMVINYDVSRNAGTHWVCLFTSQRKSCYFDPFGLTPLPEVELYCKGPREFCSFRIQRPDEVICGHYCVYVLIRMSRGVPFYDVLTELI